MRENIQQTKPVVHATEASGQVESITEEVFFQSDISYSRWKFPRVISMHTNAAQTAQLKSQKKLLLYKGKVYGQNTHILVDPGATSPSFIDR